MLIFNERSQPMILDSIHGPTLSEHMWVLDLTMMDYTLAPLTMLEEIVCPSMTIMIRGWQFVLPASWNVLVYDRDTAQLDVVQLAETAGREFTALTYGPRKSSVTPEIITVTNYHVEYKNVGPALNKHQMLCHPIGPDEWISVSPSDTYNKYLKDMIVGDLTG